MANVIKRELICDDMPQSSQQYSSFVYNWRCTSKRTNLTHGMFTLEKYIVFRLVAVTVVTDRRVFPQPSYYVVGIL